MFTLLAIKSLDKMLKLMKNWIKSLQTLQLPELERTLPFKRISCGLSQIRGESDSKLCGIFLSFCRVRGVAAIIHACKGVDVECFALA